MSAFFRVYNNLMKTRPLATDMATTGFLFGAGDFLAQHLETRQVPETPQSSQAVAAKTGVASNYDFSRTARAVVYGSLVFGPMAGKWFGYVAKVSVSNSPGVNTLARVALDQAVFAPFIGIPMYFSCMTLMESRNEGVAKAISEKLHHTWWDTVKANWIVWPAVQLANFGLVPVQLRLLVVNLVSVGWNCYLLMENSEK